MVELVTKMNCMCNPGETHPIELEMNRVGDINFSTHVYALGFRFSRVGISGKLKIILLGKVFTKIQHHLNGFPAGSSRIKSSAKPAAPTNMALIWQATPSCEGNQQVIYIYTKKKAGLSTDPCRIPFVTLKHADLELPHNF